MPRFNAQTVEAAFEKQEACQRRVQKTGFGPTTHDVNDFALFIRGGSESKEEADPVRVFCPKHAGEATSHGVSRVIRRDKPQLAAQSQPPENCERSNRGLFHGTIARNRNTANMTRCTASLKHRGASTG